MKRISTVTIQLIKEKSSLYQSNVVNSPSDAFVIVNQYLENVDREHFGILCLDTKNKVTAIHTVSIGSLNSSIVHPRELFKAAILANSNSIVLFHNHPSGDPTPSSEDITVTRRLTEAGTVMGIEVLNHVIVGDGRHISLKERGVI
jgi:DNA repair protein RadC